MFIEPIFLIVCACASNRSIVFRRWQLRILMFCNFCLFPKLHTKTKICLQSAAIVSHRSPSPNHCYGWNNHPNNKLLVPSPHSLDIIHVWPSVIDILNLCFWQSLTIYVRYGYCFTYSNNHQTPPICFKCESSTSRLHTHTHTRARPQIELLAPFFTIPIQSNGKRVVRPIGEQWEIGLNFSAV